MRLCETSVMPNRTRLRIPREEPDATPDRTRPDSPHLPGAVPDLGITKLGSYGTPSIDQHDAKFLRASDEVARKKGVRVNPRVMKAIMGVESGQNGNYPVGQCRASDGHPGPRSCGPMQIKWPYHTQRCPECSKDTVYGHIELATHVIGDTMLKYDMDEYAAYIKGYLTSNDINGTTQQEAVRALRRMVRDMERDAGGVITPPPPPPPPPPLDPWRPYPYPKMVDLHVSKPYDGAGFDRVEFRRPLIRGFSTHITDGPQSQQIEFFRDFFGTGGARQYDALTDLVIGADGRIGVLNDWRDPSRGGTRAGWANGGVDGLEGPGVAFYRRFPRINVHLVSCEHAAKAGQRWTDAELASTIEVRTAIAQEMMCPWDTYPIHPAYGVSIEQAHTFFASKSCPAEPYLTTYEPIILAEVKAKLKAWQGGQPMPEPVPVPVPTYTDYGLTEETVISLFGTMQRYNPDGSVDDLPFDPEGPLSLLWLERAEVEGNFPEAESIQLLDSSRTPGRDWFATWEGGWVAILPEGDTRASWMWLSELNNETDGT
jgi:hypothetical protein